MKINVHVKPRSRSKYIQWVENLFGERIGVVKIREKPVDGEANRGLIKSLSEFFRVPKLHINILQGQTAREKEVEIKIP